MSTFQKLLTPKTKIAGDVSGLDATQLEQYNNAGGSLAGIKSDGLAPNQQIQRNSGGLGAVTQNALPAKSQLAVANESQAYQPNKSLFHAGTFGAPAQSKPGASLQMPYQPNKSLFRAGTFGAPAQPKPATPQFNKLNQDNTMTPHIKTASEATPERLAAVHQYDSEQAFEAGFAKAAHDMGMSEQQYAQFYHIGLSKLAALQK